MMMIQDRKCSRVMKREAVIALLDMVDDRR